MDEAVRSVPLLLPRAAIPRLFIVVTTMERGGRGGESTVLFGRTCAKKLRGRGAVVFGPGDTDTLNEKFRPRRDFPGLQRLLGGWNPVSP